MRALLFICMGGMVFISSGYQGNAVAGNELMEAFSIRLTVLENNVAHEWEYDNPSHYEYETGSLVTKGQEAKAEVERMIANLDIQADKDTLDYKSTLEIEFPELEAFELRWMSQDSERYIWHWTNES